jgi:hypothetical protein
VLNVVAAAILDAVARLVEDGRWKGAVLVPPAIRMHVTNSAPSPRS